MGMDSVYRLSVVLGLVDNMSNGLSNVTNNVTASTNPLMKHSERCRRQGQPSLE